MKQNSFNFVDMWGKSGGHYQTDAWKQLWEQHFVFGKPLSQDQMLNIPKSGGLFGDLLYIFQV